MKRTAFTALLFFSLIIAFSSCTEDKWIDWKLKNEVWLEANKANTGIITTTSGLQYKVIHQGVQRNPNINSTIKVSYTGKLIDGSEFDSTADSTTIMYLSSTIEGWQEGIPKMKGGATFEFYIPSALGYGTSTSYSSIPPNSTLIFKVELVDSQY